MTYNQAMQSCIFRFISGSHSYGTNVPQSDKDYRGVFIAPLSKAFDIFQTSYITQSAFGDNLRSLNSDIKDGRYIGALERVRNLLSPEVGDLNLSVATINVRDRDEELHELRKFLKLAADCNPNIIEFLYVDRNIIISTPIWEIIRNSRNLFLSKKARYTFSGYAISQLLRIKRHRGYLLNGVKHKPSRNDFGLPEKTIIPTEHYNSILSIPDEYIRDDIKNIVKKEKAYKSAYDDWKSYDDWNYNRNEGRKELESKFGYDTKHAMHLVRLIRMAKEILIEGVVHVYRDDREELMDIRNGKWPYEKLIAYADGVDNELDTLYNNSTLRNSPDYKNIAKLYVDICKEYYKISL